MQTNQEEHLLIRELVAEDFYNGYPELMHEFTNYSHINSLEQFKNDIDKSKNYCKIIVICNMETNKIVAAGTIFKLIKLHNNPVGQIEDVIVTESYRQKKLGKLLIKELVNTAINEFKCYKVILNCLNKNIGFYIKCGFEVVGAEMRINCQ